MPPDGPTLRTRRLLLRPWRDADREPFAAMNADPAVMEHFPAVITRAESDAFVDRIMPPFVERGFGLWAVEVVGGPAFVGFLGLNPVTFEAPFAPAVEVGWRLARSAWGNGYATEGAVAALRFGFGPVGLAEVVSFTTTGNLRSRAVMERIGMTRDPTEDFDHPRVPVGSHIRPHVLYRASASTWRAPDLGR